MIRWLLRQRPAMIVTAACVLTSLIALCDWRLTFNVTLAFLYIFPLALLGTVLRARYVVCAALFCLLLSFTLDPFPLDMEVARGAIIFLTLATTGLLARGVAIGFRAQMESLTQLRDEVERRQEEITARRAVEEQLEFLIQNSPAAVLTMTPQGEILLANPAAHTMLGVPSASLFGKKIGRYIPELESIPSIDQSSNIFRTEMQTRGQREGGEFFLANVFFSTYRTASGPRLAALIVDASEDLREREESNRQQLLAGSRILVAAISHEIRNICGAIGVVHENLSRSGSLVGNQDFEALGSLIQTLGKIASLELTKSVASSTPVPLDIHETLTDLRIVLEPSCQDLDIELRWNIPDNLPFVKADRHLLMQIFLNLTKNSQRALDSAATKWIEISAKSHAEGISVTVVDSGPGIPAGRELFQPLQRGADATGLGLYLSRAFARSFQGDLHIDPIAAGCSFTLELLASHAD